MSSQWKKCLNKFLQSWPGIIILAFLIAMTFKAMIADWNVVPTGSMNPTIVAGDRIFVNKLAYDLKIPFWPNDSFLMMDPQKFNKILLDNNLSLEMIENEQDKFPRLDNSCMLVDSVKLRRMIENSDNKVDPIKAEEITNNIIHQGNSAKIPKDHYIMIGDNRTNSADARVFGLVDRRQIVGRAVAIALSCEGSIFKGKFRWHRFFKKLI